MASVAGIIGGCRGGYYSQGKKEKEEAVDNR